MLNNNVLARAIIYILNKYNTRNIENIFYLEDYKCKKTQNLIYANHCKSIW